jgi:hypothetical protein
MKKIMLAAGTTSLCGAAAFTNGTRRPAHYGI